MLRVWKNVPFLRGRSPVPLLLLGALFSLFAMLAVSAATASVSDLICDVIVAICASFARDASPMLAADSLSAAAAVAIS